MGVFFCRQIGVYKGLLGCQETMWGPARSVCRAASPLGKNIRKLATDISIILSKFIFTFSGSVQMQHYATAVALDGLNWIVKFWVLFSYKVMFLKMSNYYYYQLHNNIIITVTSSIVHYLPLNNAIFSFRFNYELYVAHKQTKTL